MSESPIDRQLALRSRKSGALSERPRLSLLLLEDQLVPSTSSAYVTLGTQLQQVPEGSSGTIWLYRSGSASSSLTANVTIGLDAEGAHSHPGTRITNCSTRHGLGGYQSGWD